jgi:hypothetical protein
MAQLVADTLVQLDSIKTAAAASDQDRWKELHEVCPLSAAMII